MSITRSVDVVFITKQCYESLQEAIKQLFVLSPQQYSLINESLNINIHVIKKLKFIRQTSCFFKENSYVDRDLYDRYIYIILIILKMLATAYHDKILEIQDKQYNFWYNLKINIDELQKLQEDEYAYEQKNMDSVFSLAAKVSEPLDLIVQLRDIVKLHFKSEYLIQFDFELDITDDAFTLDTETISSIHKWINHLDIRLFSDRQDASRALLIFRERSVKHKSNHESIVSHINELIDIKAHLQNSIDKLFILKRKINNYFSRLKHKEVSDQFGDFISVLRQMVEKHLSQYKRRYTATNKRIQVIEQFIVDLKAITSANQTMQFHKIINQFQSSIESESRLYKLNINLFKPDSLLLVEKMKQLFEDFTNKPITFYKFSR